MVVAGFVSGHSTASSILSAKLASEIVNPSACLGCRSSGWIGYGIYPHEGARLVQRLHGRWGSGSAPVNSRISSRTESILAVWSTTARSTRPNNAAILDRDVFEAV
jgi:hypothetical protein